mmetsp:Transcript_26592/g.43938  ORF Transcript_26592/g.43938 Transcript_26592/m.43938 type:complete len:110 (+) Transcript_26592:1304-1633(+)
MVFITEMLRLRVRLARPPLKVEDFRQKKESERTSACCTGRLALCRASVVSTSSPAFEDKRLVKTLHSIEEEGSVLGIVIKCSAAPELPFVDFIPHAAFNVECAVEGKGS